MSLLPTRITFLACLWMAGGAMRAQEAVPVAAEPPVDAPSAAPSADAAGSGEVVSSGSGVDRTKLNLLGQVDANSGESRRNENVTISLIDNNVLKELNTRVGATATLVEEFKADRSYFGNEFGGNPGGPPHPAAVAAKAIHGDLNWTQSNSIFTARSFFQVGSVQPARSNDYGFNVGTPLWKGASLSLGGNQRKLRGQVNGNVLILRPEERTPLATDPATRAYIARIIAQYPNVAPNRTDISPRALNTNAPQSINNDRANIGLDQTFRKVNRLSMRYTANLQQVEAFQFVGGQNPDTSTKNHTGRLNWNRQWSPNTTTDFTMAFDRTGTLIVPDETSLEHFFPMQGAFQGVGADQWTPINRAQNDFTYSGRMRQIRNRHTLDMGFDMIRRQVNGYESLYNRGAMIFGNNFGRDAAANLRYGTPTAYWQALGTTYRAFRAFNPEFYLGDSWHARGNLTINIGLRYQIATRPNDASGRTTLPYDCDCNNLAPRFGFAWRANDRWGIFRGAYGIHYGEIFTATYGQVRANPPSTVLVQINNADILDPLRGITFADLNPSSRHVEYAIDPALSTPYSHQYNFSWQMAPAGAWKVELGYVGSRTHKLFSTWFLNRARPVAGVPLTTATINDRRPDARYFDYDFTLNASHAYYDAGRMTITAPRWHGMFLDASYWFSKAIDTGGDYTTRAAGRDSNETRSPTENDFFGEMKGWSSFDQPHSMLIRGSYQFPAVGARGHLLDQIFGQWQANSVFLIKSGTPFKLETSSDAPGFGNVDGIRGDRPNIDDPSILGRTINHPDTSQQMLPAGAFSYARPDQLRGNLGAANFRKDGPFNLNASLTRRWVIGGERSLQFRAESLNLSNTPQFAQPGNNLGNDNFAQITNTLNDGRTFNFSLRLVF